MEGEEQWWEIGGGGGGSRGNMCEQKEQELVLTEVDTKSLIGNKFDSFCKQNL